MSSAQLGKKTKGISSTPQRHTHTLHATPRNWEYAGAAFETTKPGLPFPLLTLGGAWVAMTLDIVLAKANNMAFKTAGLVTPYFHKILDRFIFSHLLLMVSFLIDDLG